MYPPDENDPTKQQHENENENNNENDETPKKMKKLVHWDLLDDPKIIQQCQEQLQTNGVMVIENFATKDGLRQLRDAISKAPYNEAKERRHTPWQDQGADHSSCSSSSSSSSSIVLYPPDHPRNFMLTSSVAFVGRKTLESIPNTTDGCGDEDAGTGAAVSLYYDENNKLLNFCSKVAGKPLYHSNDENGSVYSYRIHVDHKPQWHFDESHYTAILYLQNNSTDQSGDFLIVPWCRPTKSKDDERGHEIVREVCMEQNYSKVRNVPATPGTLVFFSGAHSFHRAAPITGSKLKDEYGNDCMRLGLVFTFFEVEGYTNSDSVKNINEWDPEEQGEK